MSGDLRPWAELEDDARGAVRAVYADSFPEALSAPFEDLLLDRMLGYREPGPGAPERGRAGATGLALVRDLGGPGEPLGWTFLRYFAVGPRGGGAGSRLLAALADLLRAEGQRVLIWDVEDPDEPGLAAARVEEHRRRIAFYERAGGVLLPVADHRPPHEDGHAPRLRLMALSLDGGPLPAARDVVLGVYRWRYGCSAAHPATLAALASIPD